MHANKKEQFGSSCDVVIVQLRFAVIVGSKSDWFLSTTMRILRKSKETNHPPYSFYRQKKYFCTPQALNYLWKLTIPNLGTTAQKNFLAIRFWSALPEPTLPFRLSFFLFTPAHCWDGVCTPHKFRQVLRRHFFF